jgi:two-component system, NtrC family, response regulator AtoC
MPRNRWQTDPTPMRSLSLPTAEATLELRSATATLVVMAGAEPRRIVVPRTGSWIVGRSRQAELEIADASLSRRHARLHFEDGLEVEDLGSTNGTRVQGHRLQPGQRTVVGSHATLEFGDVLVVYRAPQGADSRDDMAGVRRLLTRAAPCPLPVLLEGETGVGKTSLARFVHQESGRRGPFVVVDCGALPVNLIESHLFGHVVGAFTGADRDAPGALAAADGGTVFLDEIGELPLSVQPRLLRVLQQAEVQPIGATRPRSLDLRFVAATCRNLEREVAEGRFREDLYFRLAGVVALVPPLRRRGDELADIAEALLADIARDLGRPALPLGPDGLAWLRAQPWPGNIRELRNALQRAIVLGEALDAKTLARCAGGSAPLREPTALSERARICEALEANAGNQTQAAKALGISRRTLVSRLDELGIPRPRKGRA